MRKTPPNTKIIYQNIWSFFGFQHLKCRWKIITWLGYRKHNIVFHVPYPIADVANSKGHQRLDKILIILNPHVPALYTKLAKLFVRKLARIYNKLMLCETCTLKQVNAAQTGLCWVSQAYCMKGFFWKQLCWFLRCSAGKKKKKKKSRFRQAVGGISS